VNQSAAKLHAVMGRIKAARKTGTPGRGWTLVAASSRRSRRRNGVLRGGLAVLRFVGQALRLPPALSCRVPPSREGISYYFRLNSADHAGWKIDKRINVIGIHIIDLHINAFGS